MLNIRSSSRFFIRIPRAYQAQLEISWKKLGSRGFSEVKEQSPKQHDGSQIIYKDKDQPLLRSGAALTLALAASFAHPSGVFVAPFLMIYSGAKVLKYLLAPAQVAINEKLERFEVLSPRKKTENIYPYSSLLKMTYIPQSNLFLICFTENDAFKFYWMSTNSPEYREILAQYVPKMNQIVKKNNPR